MFPTVRYNPDGEDMPRKLTFVIKRKKFQASPVKVDRRKLYGWTEVEAMDDAGLPCEVATTDETGRLIVPRGGTAMGLLSSKGEWVERSELKSVTTDGRAARLLPSSFDTDITLRRKVSPEEYLNHNITDFYTLFDAPDELRRLVGDDIYTFDYCYVRDCEGSPAFVLTAGESLYLLIGQKLLFEMVAFDEPGFIDEESDEGDTEELDFAMF